MLKLMEDEGKIFRAWLKKYLRDDGGMTGRALAEKIGISAQRFSQYHSGRVDNGLRTYPKIPDKIRQAILDATNTPYSEMFETGKAELIPAAADYAKNHLEELSAMIIENIRKAQTEPNIIDYQNPHKVNHHKKINEFINQEKALNMNSLAVYLEQLEPAELDRAIEYFKERIAVQEALKGVKKQEQPPAEAQGER